MQKVLTIAKKELSGYFKSPTAYIVLVLTLSVFNVFFFLIVDQNKEATLRDIFKVMEFMFVFLVPVLTMRVFAQEKSTGTMEFLLTTPTRNGTIVLGKYLGTLLFFSLIILPTAGYYGIIEYFATPDRTAALTGYAGVWLEGAMFIAIGVMISSWTSSQVVAAIGTYLLLFFLYFSVSFDKYVQGTAGAVVGYMGTYKHAEDFFAGIVTIADIVYYVSGILFCLLLTRISIGNRLWR